MDTHTSPNEDREPKVQPSASEAPKSSNLDPSSAADQSNDDVPAVRFSSAVEEIAPNQVDSVAEPIASEEITADQLREFTKSLHGQPLQERRMNTFQFEAFSLPPSRVPSREDESPNASRHPSAGSAAYRSPHGSPRIMALTSPPLTPSGSHPSGPSEKKEKGKEASSASGTSINEPQIITPQPTTSHEQPPNHRQILAHRPASSDNVLQRRASHEEHQGDLRSHRRGMMGGGAGSVPVSRESSPSRSAASNYFSKPMTPGGDANDPYAKNLRPSQHHFGKHNIDPRFVFTRRKKKQASPSSSKTNLTEKRASGIFGGDAGGSDGSSTGGHHVHHASHGSMSDLKRFFKGGHHKKRDSSPASRSGTKTPPTNKQALTPKSTHQVPFGEDHGLATKYGKLGRVLGSGAGGAVRLMKRKDDGTVFAVKEFRARHSYETEKEYTKKVTAEFCVGSTLHHGNIIETLDIVREKGSWFEVMEYGPYDLFATVMTGKMSREEIRCCFLQILNGVTYLHSLGLAHRDLKLDNVVISDKGIMKIIDFGSAHVFKYPFETDIVMAKGIVGSDPYLAPEVYKEKEYDAAATDIWSLAIIFCCMTLRRFPWKLPQMTDNSWKLFAAEPTPGHDPAKLVHPSRRTGEEGDDAASHKSSHGHHHGHHKRGDSTATQAPENTSSKEQPQQEQGQQGEKKEVIRGPWRILRLLPRESRYIIWRMLDINPKTRATMGEILAEPWVADSQMCQQLDDGTVIVAGDHTHVLQPPNNPQS